ncbi:unnamed protein product [Parajaminaea phylloscopi]
MPRRTASATVAVAKQDAGPSNSALPAVLDAATSSNAVAVQSSDPFTSNVAKLRRNWRFAAVCQFIFTFEEAFGISGFKSDALEHDLAAATYMVVPDLARRLLYTLTLDRTVSNDNWQDHLRRQYDLRSDSFGHSASQHPLGSLDSPKAWESLSLAGKVWTLHDLCEWQFADAERFRKILRTDEEPENWRIYPIGFDSKDNTYWLFDDNRLWIQYAPPPAPPKAKAPPKKGSKRARAEAAAISKAASKKSGPVSGPTVAARSSKRSASSSMPQPSPKRIKSMNGPPSIVTPRRVGSRSSRRLRGDGGEEDFEWEAIPAELLDYNSAPQKKQNGVSNPAQDEDDESELSEPPSAKAEEDDTNMSSDAPGSSGPATPAQETTDVKVLQSERDADDPFQETWVEYETLAVTRMEWESIGQRFAKSKHPDEKALHEVLRDDVCPRVLSDIAEAEKQAALEAAMAMRKRSSRIANKEAEREEERKQTEAKAAMEERMRRVRAEEEERQRKEEEARSEERKREDRLREREERIKQRESEAERKAIAEIEERERREKMRELRKRKRELVAAGEALPADIAAAESGSGTADDMQNDEDWDLRCELCLRSGRNVDLGPDEQIVCCESCLAWQHTKCWDSFDDWKGCPQRNWDEEDFFCTGCRRQRSLLGVDQEQDVLRKQDEFRQTFAPAAALSFARASEVQLPSSAQDQGLATTEMTSGNTSKPPMSNEAALSTALPVSGAAASNDSAKPPSPHPVAASLTNHPEHSADAAPVNTTRPASTFGSPQGFSVPQALPSPQASTVSAVSGFKDDRPNQERTTPLVPETPRAAPVSHPVPSVVPSGAQPHPNGQTQPPGLRPEPAATTAAPIAGSHQGMPAERAGLSSPKINSPSAGNVSPQAHRPPRPMNSAPTGSFPIRRPNGTHSSGAGIGSAPARSPLSGPSIVSPGHGGLAYHTMPPLTLADGRRESNGAAAPNGSGLNRTRALSPTPVSRIPSVAVSMGLAPSIATVMAEQKPVDGPAPPVLPPVPSGQTAPQTPDEGVPPRSGA